MTEKEGRGEHPFFQIKGGGVGSVVAKQNTWNAAENFHSFIELEI